tara:strand:+ start:586 stop:2490 length:1905 start_codon:yes stop_codon:yes gene_type:complete
MCGISGYYLKDHFSIESIHKMIRAQIHRGPDFSDFWTNNLNLVLGHNRLSIQDLSNNANQPMVSANKNVIVFNGEIYNHKEVRDLYLKKYNFRSSGDTATLLSLIENKGIHETLNIINGMFAFCYFDKNKNLLFLARDCFGEKPIYYGWLKKSFVFSSELSAIKKHHLFEKKINHKSVSLYLKYGNIPYPFSIYENIYKLEPGTYLRLNLDNNEIKKVKYWDPIKKAKKMISSRIFKNYHENKKIIKKQIVQSVKSKLISDVPIGAFLSSGIDSSLIVSIMQELSSKPINTFTIGFDDSNLNEAQDAKKIADFLNTNHNEYYFNDNDVLNLTTKMSEYYSEPFSDSSQIPTYLISNIASQKVKVCLTGDGGDELFGGYSRYVFADRINNINYSLRNKLIYLEKIFVNYTPDTFYKFLNFILKYKSIHLTRNKLKKLFNILNQNNINSIYDILVSNFTKEEILEIIKIKDSFDINYDFFITDNAKENMMLNDTINYLPNDILTKVDRASMANSLETRLPFLDKELYNSAWSLSINDKIDKNNGKVILKNILAEYLPEKLISNSKKGFAIPIDTWMRNQLSDWAKDMLSKEVINNHNIFEYNYIKKILQNHLNKSENNGNKIWLIANFNSWLLNNQ